MRSGSDERIWRREFWLGQVDARLPALLRIGLGALILGDLGDRCRDFHAFYTATGIVPDPMTPGPAVLWSLFALAGSRGATLALFAAGFPLAAAYALGYRARLTGVLAWAFVRSLQNHNAFVCDGGDAVLQGLLFWSMFVDTGAAFSLDVALRRRRARATVPAAGFRLLQLQVAYIYFVTFLAKTGATWRDGSAVYRALVSSDWGRGLAPLLAQHPRICAALTWGTLAIEGAFPLLVLSPFRPTLTRAVAIAAGLALHLGIFASMRVGIFSQVMPVSYVVFVPSGWIDAAERRLGPLVRRLRPTPRLPAPPAPAPLPASDRRRRWAAVALACLAAQVGVIAFAQIARAAGRRTPRLLAWELVFVGQSQGWHMFAPNAPLLDVRWRAPGQLADGTAVELTEAVIPELGPHTGFAYSRWQRLRNSLASKPSEVLLPLGRYVCRRHRSAHRGGPALLRFDLVADVHVVLPSDAPRERAIFHQTCTAESASASTSPSPSPHLKEIGGG